MPASKESGRLSWRLPFQWSFSQHYLRQLRPEPSLRVQQERHIEDINHRSVTTYRVKDATPASIAPEPTAAGTSLSLYS